LKDYFTNLRTISRAHTVKWNGLVFIVKWNPWVDRK